MIFIKKKEYIIGIIIMFLVLILFNSKSAFALDDLKLGQENITINVTPGLGGANFNMSNPNTLAHCIQQGQNLNDLYDGALFKVTHQVNIEGGKAIWQKINEKEQEVNSSFNVRMAWIINQPDPTGSNHLTSNYSEKQKAIYQFFPTWSKRLGISGIAINSGGYTSYLVNESEKYYEEWKNQEKAYVKNNTELNKIKKEIYLDKETNKEYLKIGPINLSYLSRYETARVYDLKGNRISTKFAKYVGKNLEIYGNLNEASTSEQDFYLLIDSSTNVNEITFKVTVSAPREDIKAKVSILQEQHGWGRQNWIVASAEVNETETEAELEIGPIKLQILGDLKIKKIDESTSKPLNKVGFKIYCKDTKEYVAKADGKQPATYTKDINKAQEFFTDKNGILEVKKLKGGNYEIYETKNPNEGYEIITNPIKVKDLVIENKVNEVTIENRKEFVTLSGIVWEDIGDGGKDTYRNDLYGNEDDLINGLTVQLLKNGKVIDETKTENGKYKFENVKIDEIANYYISFIYNGMSYQCVTPTLEKTNGSKAIEGKEREKFNNKFVEIKRGEAIGIDEAITPIEYNRNTDKYESTLDLGKENQDGKSPYYGVKEKYTITSNTKDAYNGYLDKIKTAEEIRKENIKEITNINLGLFLREQPNATLIKDLNNVKVSLKGQTHTYNYRERFNNAKLYTEEKELKDLETQVKFQGKYSEMTYTRPLYASDIAYEGSEGLTVKVIYEIGIINRSTNLKMQIPIINDYYDSKYELRAIGRSLDSSGYVNNDEDIKREEINSQNNYKSIKISSDLMLDPQKEEKIYIELEVARNKIIDILDGNTNIKLDNVAEIERYSILDEEGKVYAGIDVNSEPGNVNPIDPKTYEDDTDKAPGLSLVINENDRKVSGKVFLENIETQNDTSRIMTGEERRGNGKFDDEEKGIEGVEVQLVYADNIDEVVKVYDRDTKTFTKEATAKTDKNGDFEISGFEIGDYVLKYVWGNNEYRVQDYKGTIVDESIWNEKEQNNQWYLNIEPRYSDAIDNYETRIKIDNQLKNITNKKMNILKNYVEGSKIELEDGTQEDLITKMDSKTQAFKVNIDFNNNTNIRDEFETNPDGSLKVDSEGNLILRNEDGIKNMDFGIVERPKQQLILEKHIKQAKIVLSNGEILIDAKIIKGENGEYKLEQKVPYTVYLPETNANEGSLKIETEREIIEGAKLDVAYEITTTNVSEIDYISEKYYKFGVNEGNQVKLRANMIDYLDENLIITNQEITNEWEKISLKDKEELFENGMLDNNLKDSLHNINNIFINIGEKELISGEKTTTEITASKLLSKNNEIILNNKTEIIELEKTGGRPPEQIPGNFNPKTNEPKEEDSDISEKIMILPPTGLINNYIMYITLGISILGILTAGIVLIKKFVLKNND